MLVWITLANKGKNAQTRVTCFVSTNSTVHVSCLCFSGILTVFAKSCFKVPKIIKICIFKFLGNVKFQVNDRHLRCIFDQANHIYAKKELPNLIL